MKIVAIDASRGNYALNRSLFAVAQAAEDAGAEVSYLRLSDFLIMDCLSCRLCVMGEGCKMEDDLPELMDLISNAHGIIISGADNRGRSSRQLRALLARLRTFTEESNNRQPSLPGMGHPNKYLSKVARSTKRAIIITSCTASNSGIGAFFMPSAVHGAQVRRIRKSLAACNIDAVGSLDVGRAHIKNDQLCGESKQRAASLGRLIVGQL